MEKLKKQNESESEAENSESNDESTDANETKTSTNADGTTEAESDEDNEDENENETTVNDTTTNNTTNNESNDESEAENDSDDNSDEENEDESENDVTGDISSVGGKSSSQLLGTTKTSLSRSQAPASQASMLIGSENQSQLDIDGLTEQITEIETNKLNTDPTNIKKNTKNLKIQRYFTYKNEPVYTLSAKAFTQFEDMVFNLMSVNNVTMFNPEDPDLRKITKLADFDKPEFTSAFVPDMKILNQQLDFSVRGYPRLNQQKLNKQEVKNLKKDTKASIDYSKSDAQEFKNEKIITIIVNGITRPRKIVRILLNKRNSSSFDQLTADICNALKLEYGIIRKLYTLRGVEVPNPTDLSKFENVFLAVGNEKISNKDFELDQEEAFLVFANELMKPTPNFKISKIAQRFLHKKSASKANQKDKPDIKASVTPFDTDPDKLPDDLLQNYKVGDIIGEGNFATIRECVDINTGIKFALKIIDVRKCKGREYMIENELKILRKVKHPNIIKLVEEYRSEHKFYLIMELLKNGDLLDAITTTSKYTERDAACMVYNLASAVAYLHSLNIVHRDIKLENVLIHKHPDGGKTLKLGDFGLAVEIKEPINQICGSPTYVAPEILMGKNYGLEVDIWSLGVISYILLCGFAPFRGETDEEAYKAIKNENLEFLSPYWDNISVEAKDLIQKMLTRDQKKRITATEILQHPWLTEDQQAVSVPASSATNNRSTNSSIKTKTKDLHEDVSKHLTEFFRRSSRDPAIALVSTTALDKEAINITKTPTLDTVDEHNEDL